MKYYQLMASIAVLGFLLSACTNVVPPHVALECKTKYDLCMVKNTFKGPLKSHEICLAEREPACRNLPTP